MNARGFAKEDRAESGHGQSVRFDTTRHSVETERAKEGLGLLQRLRNGLSLFMETEQPCEYTAEVQSGLSPARRPRDV